LLVAASERQFVCVGCGSKHGITTFFLTDNTATASTASAFGKAILSRGANCEQEDHLIPGFTVVGGYGWAPTAGTRITLAVCADCLKIATVPLTPIIVEMSYERLVGFDFQGGAMSTGGGFFGGGFGVEGAVKGMLVASVLNSLTEKTTINTVVRISAVDGELYIHHGGALPDALRTLLARAVNAVAARGRSAAIPAGVADSVTRLEKLAKLHEGGALSDDEFRTAKQKILGEFV